MIPAVYQRVIDNDSGLTQHIFTLPTETLHELDLNAHLPIEVWEGIMPLVRGEQRISARAIVLACHLKKLEAMEANQ